MSKEVSSEPARLAVIAAARRSYGKLVAFLSARTRDVAAAEDALAAAFEAAVRDWPINGVPANPEAWLLTTARRQAIDAARRQRTQADALPDLLLLFACAHPAIERSVRAPLMLQTVLGFDAASIGSAFLVAPSTMGQRLVRAKAKIKQAGIPFRLPEHDDLAERLDSVLEAIYACFSEGWSDPSGTEARRRNLAEEGIWLGHLVVTLMPDAAEALGLLSLMLHAQARANARRDANGAYVPLSQQDPTLWDAALIHQAEALLLRASRFNSIGRYQLEAAIQSAHSIRRSQDKADWPAIVQLYDALLALTGSPVVAVNRAVAFAEVHGALAGLVALDALNNDVRLAEYQPFWAARAELLARQGLNMQAREAYARAIGLEADPAVRCFLLERSAAFT